MESPGLTGYSGHAVVHSSWGFLSYQDYMGSHVRFDLLSFQVEGKLGQGFYPLSPGLKIPAVHCVCVCACMHGGVECDAQSPWLPFPHSPLHMWLECSVMNPAGCRDLSPCTHADSCHCRSYFLQISTELRLSHRGASEYVIPKQRSCLPPLGQC